MARSAARAAVDHAHDNPAAVKERILETASALFYRRGVRAVGVDLVVEEAGVAKTSLYRHFRTKDDLVAAFLAREDEDFWTTWDRVADRHKASTSAAWSDVAGSTASRSLATILRSVPTASKPTR
mgnify:CR=1 FL=1